MENNLEDLFPENLAENEQQILDLVMGYNGPNNEGLTILEAIDDKIKDEFSDDKIYSDKSSAVVIDVMMISEKKL